MNNPQSPVRRGNLLIEKIQNSTHQIDGKSELELLELIGNDFAIDRIKPLFKSSNEFARESAIWIAVEEPDVPLEFKEDVAKLSGDGNFRVRYWCVDFFLRAWENLTADEKSLALCLKDDDHPAVSGYANEQFAKVAH